MIRKFLIDFRKDLGYRSALLRIQKLATSRLERIVLLEERNDELTEALRVERELCQRYYLENVELEEKLKLITVWGQPR